MHCLLHVQDSMHCVHDSIRLHCVLDNTHCVHDSMRCNQESTLLSGFMHCLLPIQPCSWVPPSVNSAIEPYLVHGSNMAICKCWKPACLCSPRLHLGLIRTPSGLIRDSKLDSPRPHPGLTILHPGHAKTPSWTCHTPSWIHQNSILSP